MTDTTLGDKEPRISAKTKSATPTPLIRPPCVLVGLDGNAWAIVGRVKSALYAAGRSDIDLGAIMTTMSSSYDQTLSLALSLVTPVELEKSYSAKWRPFFHALSTRKAYEKACVGAPIWRSSKQPLADFLANKGDINARDAFGRDWLFFASTETRAGDFDAALALTPKPLSRDSMGLPFFANGLAPELAKKALKTSSADDAAAACAPDNVFHASPAVWLLSCLYKDALGLGSPSIGAVADCLEALRLKGLSELTGGGPKSLAGNLAQSLNIPHGKNLGLDSQAKAHHDATRLAVELALLSQEESSSIVSQQLKEALEKAIKANPALRAIVDGAALESSLPHGSRPSRSKSV